MGEFITKFVAIESLLIKVGFSKIICYTNNHSKVFFFNHSHPNDSGGKKQYFVKDRKVMLRLTFTKHMNASKVCIVFTKRTHLHNIYKNKRTNMIQNVVV